MIEFYSLNLIVDNTFIIVYSNRFYQDMPKPYSFENKENVIGQTVKSDQKLKSNRSANEQMSGNDFVCPK